MTAAKRTEGKGIPQPLWNGRSRLRWSIATGVLVAALLAVVQLRVDPPILLAERWHAGAGWVQIALAALLGGFLYMKMADRRQRDRWRRRAWMFFALWFFIQLGLGLFADSFFLLNGKLHFPVPGLILAGPVYRWQPAFMPILFLCTVLLSGGAWCSQLCYFGAFDSWAASAGRKRRRPKKRTSAGATSAEAHNKCPAGRDTAGEEPQLHNRKISRRTAGRFSVLGLFILTAMILRLAGAPPLWATVAGAAAGVAGIMIVAFVSPRKGFMSHCSAYCPLGTAVSYLKYLSPFRYRIDPAHCTRCMACTAVCRYGALGPEDIRRAKPGINCTLCGACLPKCSHGAMGYRFPSLAPATAEKLWLCVTIVLWACFLAIARV